MGHAGGITAESLVLQPSTRRRSPERTPRTGRRWRRRRRGAGRPSQRLVGGDARVAVAHGPWHGPGRDVRGGLVDERREQAREQIDLDSLPEPGALALVQGRDDRLGGKLGREHVHDGDADFAGLAAGVAGDRHEAADALQEEVVAGQLGALAGRPEARHRAVHHPRVRGGDVLVAEAEAGSSTWTEVLDDDVGALASARALRRPSSVPRSQATPRLLRLMER